MQCAAISLMHEARFGNILITFVLRLNSSNHRSSMLVDHIRPGRLALRVAHPNAQVPAVSIAVWQETSNPGLKYGGVVT